MRTFGSLVLCGALLGGRGVATQACGQQTRQAERAELRLGDPMPPLSDQEWLKGEPVTQWEEGKVYVLDFWATWCGPCLRAMPHMIETQEKYAEQGVQIIGVSVWERDKGETVRQFTKDRTDINYTISYDRSEVATNDFMRATNSRGIPTVMIVDQKGRFAWKGHPMSGMDEALEQIVKGEFNIEEAIKAAEIERERERRRQMAMQKAQPVIAQINEASENENWNVATTKLIELASMEPEFFGNALLRAYEIAGTELEDAKMMRRISRRVLSAKHAEDSALLNAFAWMIIDPSENNPFREGEMQDIASAVKAAEMAVELTEEEDGSILDTLAWAYYADENFTGAVEAQEKAIAAAKTDAEKASYRNGLETFKAAAEGK